MGMERLKSIKNNKLEEIKKEIGTTILDYLSILFS